MTGNSNIKGFAWYSHSCYVIKEKKGSDICVGMKRNLPVTNPPPIIWISRANSPKFLSILSREHTEHIKNIWRQNVQISRFFQKYIIHKQDWFRGDPATFICLNEVKKHVVVFDMSPHNWIVDCHTRNNCLSMSKVAFAGPHKLLPSDRQSKFEHS